MNEAKEHGSRASANDTPSPNVNGDVPGGEPPLFGRQAECEILGKLIAGARAGRGGALVVRGEPGAGKTALLDYLVRRASGLGVVAVAGIESEQDCAFAALQRLCGLLPDGHDRLAGPQRDALAAAFGERDADSPDRFLVGLAFLNLICEAATDRPVVCVVDDAQWLDEASALTLAFAARHLAAGPVAVLLAARPPGKEHELTGLAELAVGGLADRDAWALLSSAVVSPLDERVRDQIVTEARGNPGVLLKLAAGMSRERLAGGFGLPSAVKLAPSVEENFRKQLATLPEATRRLLLVAAAEPTADRVLIWQAATMLGVRVTDAEPAVGAGLIESAGPVRFRDPLARFAIYQTAPLAERQRVHRALAVTADPDRRRWHRGHAASEPAENLAAELERAVPAARARGGLAADAAFRERAAELTPEPGKRSRRALAAAEVKHQAGAAEGARRLLGLAQAGPLDELGRSRAELLRARLTADAGSRQDALPLLVKAALRLEPLHPGLARRAYRDVFWAALTSGRRPAGCVPETARAVGAMPRRPGPLRPGDLLLDGLATLITEGCAAGAPLLKRALAVFRETRISLDEGLGWLPLACRLCGEVWEDLSWSVLSARLIGLARDAGALSVLPAALESGAVMQVLAGDLTGALRLLQQAETVAWAAGHTPDPGGPLILAAWEGQDRTARRLVSELTASGGGQGQPVAGWAAAVLHNGLSRYDEAMAAAAQASVYPGGELGPAAWSLAELIEAAARCGRLAPAAAALERLSEATDAAATDWALGIQARCRALLSGGEAAELGYAEAIERLSRTRVHVELARAHLVYGEWLRRENRRVEAREQLRVAHQMLTAMGIGGFAERARAELVATGETVRRHGPKSATGLTPQEIRVARLALDGRTNPEISTQLFLSPRTVEWHLRKVFTKLGISSRRELSAVLPDLGRDPMPA